MFAALKAMLAGLPCSFHICPNVMDSRVLHPDEWALTRNYSPKRLTEFCSGRHCAHIALANLGYAGYPVLRDPQGAPQWPEGITGSISHSGQWAVAVVAATNSIRAIGVDIQHMQESFPYQVLPSLLHPREITPFLCAAERSSCHAYAVFSAKESAIKCGYMANGELLEQVELIVDLDWYPEKLTVVLPRESDRVRGYAGVDLDYVFTLVWMSANGQA
ncbi:MAG: 4'-phosphopantetheinyl transferase superfamily protein [Nitrosomonas sp.]|jgi:4'-phosphopantetheinyl transferase EntD|nr:4'-phosphopantetheinyl transferase superfamily protein [Nitrosomonas sp.]MCC7136785.1 4'-phosphopantetheinyl transferase superfamily protein [Nitrosomonas sp.]